MKWIEYPFLRITSALIIGILINNSFKYTNISCFYLMLFAVIIFSFYFLLSWNSKNLWNKKLRGGVGLFSFILMGYLSSQLNYDVRKPLLSPDSLSASTFYTSTIISKPASTAKTIKYKVEIDQVKFQDSWSDVYEEAILYFNKNDTPPDFDYGDKLLIKGHPVYVENQKNPYAFDYALYLQRQGIYLQDYISTEDFMIINENHGSSPYYLSLYIGDYAEKVLSTYISSERELNMAKAMLIGRREEITPEMEYVYESSGTAHILAVSGLHVGIIYLIFSSIFKFLKRRKSNWIYFGINFCAIWSFAFITGLSPSAQRAATMLTFILIAEFTQRKSSIYNTILASAFFILLFFPNLLFSVSFQLSFTAVFGIVYLYKKIYRLIYVKHRFINFFWQITALSLSAQLATFPITIYYFNQFPVLFLFTNLIAIPTAILTIVGGLLLLATSQLGFVPILLGKVLGGWIYFYNEIMVIVSRLTFATLEDLYLKPIYVFLIICCVIFVLQFITTKKLYFFRYFSILLFVLSGLVIVDHYQKSRQQEVIFYHVNNKRYFDIYLGQNCFTNINSNNVEIRKEVNFNITPARNYHLIKNVYDLENLKIVREIGSNTLIHWNNKTILILNELHSLTKKYTHIPIDYLVIGKEMIRDLPEITGLLNIKNLILDSTVSKAAGEKVRHQVNGNDTNIHSIKIDGAYKISI